MCPLGAADTLVVREIVSTRMGSVLNLPENFILMYIKSDNVKRGFGQINIEMVATAKLTPDKGRFV